MATAGGMWALAHFLLYLQLKLFSEKNYVSPNRKLSEAWLPKFWSTHYCHTDIIYKEWLETMHKHTFGQNLTLQSAGVT